MEEKIEKYEKNAPISFKNFKYLLDSVMESEKYFLQIYDATKGAVDFLESLKFSDCVPTYISRIFEDKGEWVSYFITELDWGKRWEPGRVTENDVDIPLATLEDLYCLLCEGFQKRRNAQ